ncbi:DNA mismatch repair protein MutL [Nitrosococcus halophilus Nc 4]|uniref:DNA mismatch repair protein MutL n=1 Tax=Nitrosococcus halophilus (strain Nc4) TaxID=472759 RepID=D5C1A8_NITHN|nr:DNA mismatch repair endonuclease MutL [Nitrosococcus halophilus]ADE16460.1 DNA mismatch repair protein MutL [Nitrosococcus halophilus Nc 4]
MVAPSLPRIQLLPPALANQIAAGEVVERPASVLKELVENALDAGAQRIEIESEAGGIGLIRVRDDGCGIHPEDLCLALSSHATSKIRQQEQLLNITTLGFRGEALASISAVSHLSLNSRVVNEEYGWCLRENTAVQPVAHPVGTTVEVRDLFYNTPARRRFLRGEKTEFMHLRATLERLALSHFEVSFRVSYNRRPLFTLPSCLRSPDQLKRIAKICGQAFTEHSLYFKREIEGLRLWGWLGHPEFCRSQTNLQYFYVNQRMVRDRLLTHATRQAYGNRLPPGRHPAYLLYLELPPSQVDVNAHPAKNEVRFREARQVHGFVVRTLTEILEQAESEGAPKPTADAPLSGDAPHGSPLEVPICSQQTGQALQPKPHGTPHKGRLYPVAEAAEHYSPLPRGSRIPSRKGNHNESSLLGQAQALVLGRYLLAENHQGLVLVDLPAARARLAQARLRAAYARDHITRQPLLLPLTFKVSPQQAEWTEQHASELLTLGFGLHRLGPSVVVLREIPASLRELNLEQWLPALLTRLTEQQQEKLEETPLKEIIVSFTGRYPAPTISPPSLQEMNVLLRELEKLYQNEPDLKSKPPWHALPKNKIEEWFAPD